MKRWLPVFGAICWSLGIIFFLHQLLGYLDGQWTNASMEMAKHQEGNMIQMKDVMFQWAVGWWVALAVGIAAIIGPWILLWRRGLIVGVGLLSIFLLAGCGNNVVITPPNYGIVINMNETSQQVDMNNFDSGNVQIGQITVNTSPCGNSTCFDKMVVEVGGSPESRLYTADPNTGTSTSNQSLCFAASGSNGCIDFSIDAIVRPDDVKCYANKVGADPVQGEIYHFKAKPLGAILDTKVVQKASSVFAPLVVTVNPLDMEIEKFKVFDQVREKIITQVHEQTCITLTDLSIIGGVNWSSPSVQQRIDDANVAKTDAEIARLRTESTIAQMQALEKAFGKDAAVELYRLQKWDGHGWPLPLGNISGPPVAAPVPAPTEVPTPAPTPAK